MHEAGEASKAKPKGKLTEIKENNSLTQIFV